MNNNTDPQKDGHFWASSCLKKKKLKSQWADRIVMQAKSEGNYLRKYMCPHCLSYHVTSKKYKENELDQKKAA